MKSKGKILVTGGTGYIGSHTVVALLQEKYEVIILDNLYNSHYAVLQQIQQITGILPKFYFVDLLNSQAVADIFKCEKNISTVIHFAAVKSVGESQEVPLLYYENNIAALIGLLKVMKQYQCHHFVFSSSATVYGYPDRLPIAETQPLSLPLSPYGVTKQLGEKIIQDACSTGDFRAISLRYFNPVGASMSGLLGETPARISAYSNLMPIVVDVAAGKSERVTVYGCNYPTRDGSCIRDYIHVDDLAAAHSRSVAYLLKKSDQTNYEVFNVGTGQGISVFEMINAFETVNGIAVPFVVGDPRKGDAAELYADVSKIRHTLDWKARFSLDDIVRSSWQWHLASHR